MKRVLFFIPDLGFGGAERVLVNLVNNLDKKLFDVTVMTVFDTGVNKANLSPDIHYKYYYKKQFRGNSHYFKLFSPKTLYKKMIADDYDIIVSYLEGVTARIVGGCDDDKVKLVSWIHTQHYNQNRLAGPFRSKKEAFECYNRFDLTACVSKNVKEDFEKIFNFKMPVRVYYNTIETDKILKLATLPVDDLEFVNGEKNIISVGKIIEVKGFKRLAEVHKRLVDDGIKSHVYILGEGEEKKEIEEFLAKNNLTDSFTFLGYKENPYKYISKCDLYVCSSYREGFSTSVTEALITGTPVVTTLCSGMDELLGSNNEYGIITENNTDALYSGVKKMLTDDELLLHYKQKASERGKKFSKENTVDAVSKMLLNL